MWSRPNKAAVISTAWRSMGKMFQTGGSGGQSGWLIRSPAMAISSGYVEIFGGVSLGRIRLCLVIASCLLLAR